MQTKTKAPVTVGDVIAWFDERQDKRDAFLRANGLAAAILTPVGEDCAFRRYFRLHHNDRAMILMEAVPDNAEFVTPGHKLSDFIRIGTALRDTGVATPQVYAADAENGYVLLEDFGSTSFKQALEQDLAREDAYALATDVLTHMRQAVNAETLALPRYYDSHVHTALRRVIDWYLPAIRQQRNADGLAGEYLAVWQQIEDGLPPCPQGFLHIDFHFENLMWRPQRTGLAQCGVLDFQGAMIGPQPYDLANLLEDARVDVPLDIRMNMLARYTSGMDAAERDLFLRWYRILATQFHCRVIGQFIRLAVKDGKPRYLPMIPRLQNYIIEGLKDPILSPLREFFAAQSVSFTEAVDFEPSEIAAFIREDAF
mgnify:CR=1 FL=1